MEEGDSVLQKQKLQKLQDENHAVGVLRFFTSERKDFYVRWTQCRAKIQGR